MKWPLEEDIPALETSIFNFQPLVFGRVLKKQSLHWPFHKAKQGGAEMIGNRSSFCWLPGAWGVMPFLMQEVAIKAVLSNSYRIATVTNEFDERIRHLYSLNCSPTVPRGWKALSPTPEAPKLVCGYKLRSSSLQIDICPTWFESTKWFLSTSTLYI